MSFWILFHLPTNTLSLSHLRAFVGPAVTKWMSLPRPPTLAPQAMRSLLLPMTLPSEETLGQPPALDSSIVLSLSSHLNCSSLGSRGVLFTPMGPHSLDQVQILWASPLSDPQGLRSSSSITVPHPSSVPAALTLVSTLTLPNDLSHPSQSAIKSHLSHMPSLIPMLFADLHHLPALLQVPQHLQ